MARRQGYDGQDRRQGFRHHMEVSGTKVVVAMAVVVMIVIMPMMMVVPSQPAARR